jgi:hypothetical protein
LYDVLRDAPQGGVKIRAFDVEEELTMAFPTPIVHGYTNGSHELWLLGLEEEALTVLFAIPDGSPTGLQIRVPLTFVSAVWREATDGRWSIAVRGSLQPDKPIRFQPHAV